MLAYAQYSKGFALSSAQEPPAAFRLRKSDGLSAGLSPGCPLAWRLRALKRCGASAGVSGYAGLRQPKCRASRGWLLAWRLRPHRVGTLRVRVCSAEPNGCVRLKGERDM